MDYLEEAKNSPIMFSQVREDPRIDLRIVSSLNKNANVLMVSSGGCTLAVLAQNPQVESIDAIDINQAQISLSKLKLHLLKKSPRTRSQLLGHTRLTDRSTALSLICSKKNIPITDFGKLDPLNTYGPDYIGRYEWLFRAFSERFVKTKLATQLSLVTSFNEQRSLLNQDLSEVKGIFDEIFSLNLLVELFGDEATQNRKRPYADHFFDRFRWSLTNQYINKNPFFYQFSYFKYPRNASTLFLSLPQRDPIDVQFHSISMYDHLSKSKSSSYDYIHLSNILDWLDEQFCHQVIGEVSRVLRPKGKVCIRQLNSSMKIRNTEHLLFEEFSNTQLIDFDLSFFYPKIFIGEKQ